MDRVSCLHESIRSHIIRFLPTTDEAIRTKILSKQWRDLWVPTQNLVFSPTVQKHTHSYLAGIANFINRTLPVDIGRYEIRLRRTWPRDTFINDTLSLTYLDLAVQAAIKRHVTEIILELQPNTDPLAFHRRIPITIPPSLCLYTSLQTLTLRRHCFPVAYKGGLLHLQWTSLKALTLESTLLHDELIPIILRSCPKLEYLEFNQCYHFHRNIDASGSSCLRKLVVIQHKDFPSLYNTIISAPKVECLILKLVSGLELKNISSLVDVYLDFEEDKNVNRDWLFREESRDMFMEILNKVSHVKRLTLGSWCIKVISSFLWKGGLHSTIFLPKCKSLVFETPLDEWDIPGILSLLRNSPYLETLVVDSTIGTNYNAQFFSCNEIGEYDAAISCEQQTNYLKQFLGCLKTVKIVGLSTHVFDLAKLILQNAKNLEKMILTKCNRKNDSSRIIHDILQLPRLSPAAQILVY